MSARYSKPGSLIESLGGSAKTGSGVFALFAVLDLASKIIELLFRLITLVIVKIWRAVMKKARPDAAPYDEEELIRFGIEMFKSFPAAEQLRQKMMIKEMIKDGRLEIDGGR